MYYCIVKIIQQNEEDIMALLEVKNLKKIYTTRLGGNKVLALENLNSHLRYF